MASSSRGALVLSLALLLSACGAPSGEDAGQTDEALASSRVVVHGFDGAGPRLVHWGYDVKEAGKSRALTPKLATELFQDIGMNLLRTPIRAAEAHPAAGVAQIVADDYTDDLHAIANAKAARKDVAIFASLKLLGKSTFPDWVKTNGEVDAERYAVLLENYLLFMKEHDVTIDWLGVDNERKWNEGNITPAKYDAIARHLEMWCAARGVKAPHLVAPEDYGPTEDTPWLRELWNRPSRFEHVDRVGVHLYSKQRDAAYVAAIGDLADAAHGETLWDSELHWDDVAGDGMQFDDIALGMLMVMDHFDAGFGTISWWAFEPASKGTKTGYVMSDLVHSTVGAQILRTDDGAKVPANGRLNARALKSGAHEVTVWVANLAADDRNGQWIEIEGQKVKAASYVQWSPFSSAEGRTGAASVAGATRSSFAMTYPSKTITRVTVTVD